MEAPTLDEGSHGFGHFLDRAPVGTPGECLVGLTEEVLDSYPGGLERFGSVERGEDREAKIVAMRGELAKSFGAELSVHSWSLHG